MVGDERVLVGRWHVEGRKHFPGGAGREIKQGENVDILSLRGEDGSRGAPSVLPTTQHLGPSATQKKRAQSVLFFVE